MDGWMINGLYPLKPLFLLSPSFLGSKIVVEHLFLPCFLLLIQFLDQLSNISFNLKGLSTNEMLLLVSSEKHGVLLFGAEVE